MTMHGYEPCMLKNAGYMLHLAENRDQGRVWLKTGTSGGYENMVLKVDGPFWGHCTM